MPIKLYIQEEMIRAPSIQKKVNYMIVFKRQKIIVDIKI